MTPAAAPPSLSMARTDSRIGMRECQKLLKEKAVEYAQQNVLRETAHQAERQFLLRIVIFTCGTSLSFAAGLVGFRLVYGPL